MENEILHACYQLWNGVEIPKVGLGTWLIRDEAVAQAVRSAVELGYRHIDTAQAYLNERGVGEGLRTCGVPRGEIFLTTKLAAEIKEYKRAVQAIDESLQRLGVDYIDLMIIHSPQPWTDFHAGEHFYEGNLEAWRALEEAYSAGKLRAIGVSNFERADLDNILQHGSVKPMVNQILAHVGNTPFDLVEYSQKQGLLVEAYSPVAHGAILGHEEVARLAAHYGVSVPQLCIRYCLELGMLPLPKTANPDHMRTNASLDFTIAPSDMEVLKAVAPVVDYGEGGKFPVFGGTLYADGRLEKGNYKRRS